MFGCPLPLPWGYGLAAVLALWLIVQAYGFALGSYNAARTSRFIPWTKMCATALLVACAAVWWFAGSRGTALGPFSLLIMIGVAFGFLGDMTLAGFIPLPRPMLFGILWFALGHAFYIAACAQLIALFRLNDGVAFGLAIAGMTAVGLITWRLFVASPAAGRVLHYGSLGYCLLLSGTAGLALGLAVQEPRLATLAVGLLLFMASDTLLGNCLFRKNEFYLTRDVNWALYTVGQLLIVFATPAAMQLH